MTYLTKLVLAKTRPDWAHALRRFCWIAEAGQARKVFLVKRSNGRWYDESRMVHDIQRTYPTRLLALEAVLRTANESSSMTLGQRAKLIAELCLERVRHIRR